MSFNLANLLANLLLYDLAIKNATDLSAKI